MALTYVPPPPAVWESYQQSLMDLVGPHEPENNAYHVPVGSLDAETLAKGATLDDIAQSGCRIISSWGNFVPGMEGAITSVEMTDPSTYTSAKFRNFVHGDLPAQAYRRIVEAAELMAMRTTDYELHFLSVPTIQLQALHLICQGPGKDLILPVLSGDPRLSTDAILEADEFLAIARTIATERLALPSSDLSS
jgi:hypothetical protein